MCALVTGVQTCALPICGFLREGYWADLALVDDTPFTVRREDVLSKCAWSPFEGTTFHSRIASTWVNGQLVWDGERIIGEPQGQRLEFDRLATCRSCRHSRESAGFAFSRE